MKITTLGLTLMVLPFLTVGTNLATSTASHQPDVIVTITESFAASAPVYRFEPAMVQVTPGMTVQWRNEGRMFHTVTSTAGTTSDSFDAPLGGWGDCHDDHGRPTACTFEHTFESAGLLLYQCAPHVFVGMHGSVVAG